MIFLNSVGKHKNKNNSKGYTYVFKQTEKCAILSKIDQLRIQF